MDLVDRILDTVFQTTPFHKWLGRGREIRIMGPNSEYSAVREVLEVDKRSAERRQGRGDT